MTTVPPGEPARSGRMRHGKGRGWRVAVAVLAACGALLALALPASAQTEVPANWPLVPAGLEEGDQFRLLFVTSRQRTASSTSIAAYDGFVRGLVGNGHPDIRQYSSLFKVLGSTASVNARDHTGTTGSGVPIYWLNGDSLPGGGKVADSYGDFYDGSWDNVDPLAGTEGHTNRPGSKYTREDGNSRAMGTGTGLYVRTGTYKDGTKWNPAVHSAGSALDVGPLGSEHPAVAIPVPRGIVSASTHASHPLGTYHIKIRNSISMQFYGLSSVFRVVATVNHVPSGEPTIVGTAQVWETLRVNISSIMDADGLESPSYRFQWLADEAAIAGATFVRYTLAAAEQGKRIKVRVAFTDDAGNEETLTSAATAAVAAADTHGEGDLRLRDGSSATNGRLEVHLGGRWGDVCDDGFGDEEGAVACRQLGYPGFSQQVIAPPIGSGIFLMDDVVCTGSENRLVDCRYTSEHDCLIWEPVGISCVPGAPSGEPAIAGTARVGETLSADTSSIVDGDGPASPSFSYQWLADEEEIAGATGATYTLTAAEQGKRIKVRVSFTNAKGNEETVTSAATEAVAGADTPLAGDLRLRDGMSASSGRLEVYRKGRWGYVCDDYFGDDEGTVACRQLGYAGLVEVLAEFGSSSDDFLMDDVACTGSEGRLIDCVFRSDFHNCQADEAVGVFCSTGVNQAPGGAPTITGTVQVGETLSADTSSIVDGDGPASPSFSYQWLADEVAGATGATYTLTAAEQGKVIQVRVSYRDGAGNEETLTSAATEAVIAAAPVASGSEGDLRLRDGSSVSSGRLQVYLGGRWGDVCDDGFGDEEGEVVCRQLGYPGFAERLFESGSGIFLMDDVVCTGSEDRLIDCRYATQHNCHFYEAVGISCSTGVNQAPGGAPTITGTVQVGETLSADTSSIVDGDGPASPSFSYQWLADEEAIAGATGATYTLTAAEQGKVIQVRVSYRDGAGNEETLTSAATAAVSIADDDTAGVAVSAGALRVPEGGSGSYTVVLESEPEGEVTVTAAVAAGTDVTVSPESLTFTADTWSSAQRVTVRAAEDADALADAVVTVSHAVSGYGAVTEAADVAVTIQENDTAGVAVSPTGLTVLEGGSGSYTVVLESEPEGEVTVTAAVAAGTDVTVSPQRLRFTAGNWSEAQEVRVRAAEDADALADAVVTVRHAVSGYGAVTAAAAVAVTIAENDTAGVAASAGALRVPEGGSGSYTVALESEPAGEVTVTAAVAAGTDVTVTPDSLRFTAGNWSEAQEVRVRAAEDADAVADAVVTVSHAVSGYGAVTAAAVLVTIAENDTAGVAVSAGALSVPEGGSRSYTVVLESEPEGEVTVTATVAAGTDVAVSPQRLRFTTGNWSVAQEVRVRAAEDADALADAEVTVSHAVSGYGAVTTAADVAVTIQENDTAGVAVSPTGLTVLEGGSGSYTVVLESEPEGEVTVTATVAAGTDVTVTPDSLRFTAGNWSEPQEVKVQAAEDADALADAEVTVRHAVSGYGAVTEAADVAVTIQENDTAGVAVSPTGLTVLEGGSGSYTVVLESEPEGEVTVTATVAAGTDVAVTPDSLRFTAGNWSEAQEVRVRAAEDADALADAEVTVSHAVSGYGAVTTAAAVTVTVTENDTAGVAVSPTGLTVLEGGSGSYTVVLESEPEGEVTVTAAVAAGTDVTVTPDSLRFTAGNWSEAQEVRVRAAEDADALADAEVTVRHAVSGYGAVTEAADVAVTIAENDTAGVAVSAGALRVPEGGSGSYTVALESEPAGEVTVTPAVPSGTDVTVTPESLRFTAGNWSEPQEVTLRAAEDADAEVEAVVTVSHAVSGYGAVTEAADVAVTIEEQDTAGVVVTPTGLSVPEGGSGSYTVVLESEPEGEVTVTAAVAAGTDVTVSPQRLRFTAGNWSEAQEVRVRAAEDADALADAEVTVSHAVSGYGAVTTAAAVLVTIQEKDTAVAPAALTVDIRPADAAMSFPTNAKFTLALEFTVAVTGLELEEIEVSNGTAAKLSGGGASYTVAVTPLADFEGGMTVAIAAGAAQDGAGAGNAAARVEFAVDTKAPTVRSATTGGAVEGWTAPVETGAGTTVGGVEYPEEGSSRTSAGGSVRTGGASGGYGHVTLNYDERLDERVTPPAEAYLVRVGEERRAVTAVTVSGSRVRLRLATPVASGRQVTVSYAAAYAAAGLRDVAGNAAGSVTQAVTNGAVAVAAERYERVNRELLGHAGAALSAGTVAAIGERIEAVGAGAAQRGRLSLAGRQVEPALDSGAGWEWTETAEPRRIRVEELIGGGGFVVPLGAGAAAERSGGGTVALWGSGDYRSLAGGGSAVEWSGDLLGVHVGADLRVVPELLAGVAVSWSQGRFDYTERKEPGAGDGEYAIELISVHPYASWWLPGVGLWATAGYGWGEVAIEAEAEAEAERTSETRLLTSTVAGSGRLLSTDGGVIAGGTTELRLKAEGTVVRIELQGNGVIAPLELDTRRLRVLLEGSHAQRAEWGRLTPVLEVGLRYDEGDGAAGAGLELGGELRYEHPGLGLTVAGQGRLLATHQAAYEEWGVGGLLRLELGAGGEGLRLSVEPGWGVTASGTRELWEHGVLEDAPGALAAGSTEPGGRLEAELGYGLPAWDGRGLLTPYGGLTLGADERRDYRAGARLELEAFELRLEGTRRERAGAGADHELTLRGGLRL